MSLPLLGGGHGGGSGSGGSSGSAEATAFLARTTGLDATHTNAYTALIDGLVSDGVWSKLDALYIFATQDATTANLNLISTSYPASPSGSPTFTADNGYTGASSGPKNIHTGFIPSTASSPKFTRNSAHISMWGLNNINPGGATVMGSGTSGAITGMHIRYVDNNSYYYCNSSGNDLVVANASSVGHFLANRSTSSAAQGYKNGSSVVTNNSSTSTAVTAQEIYVCGQNDNGAAFGVGNQTAMASIGSSLNSTEAGNFYTRLRTYMTAVGVP